MKKTALSTLKSRIKPHVPTAIAAVSTVTLLAYVAYVKKTNNESIKFRVTPHAKQSFDEGCLTKWTSENSKRKVEINIDWK